MLRLGLRAPKRDIFGFYPITYSSMFWNLWEKRNGMEKVTTLYNVFHESVACVSLPYSKNTQLSLTRWKVRNCPCKVGSHTLWSVTKVIVPCPRSLATVGFIKFHQALGLISAMRDAPYKTIPGILTALLVSVLAQGHLLKKICEYHPFPIIVCAIFSIVVLWPVFAYFSTRVILNTLSYLWIKTVASQDWLITWIDLRSMNILLLSIIPRSFQ